MARGGGGGHDVLPNSGRARLPRRGGRQRHQAQAAAAPYLPLDVIVEIAAHSDAATLVRCAATRRALRRRIAGDANLRGRLRLRDTGRFVLPLLRGHLAGTTTYDHEGDGTAADTTRVVEATFAAAAAEAEALTDPLPVDSRGGLVLVRASATPPPWQLHDHQRLLVCNPATGRHLALPPEPEPAFGQVTGSNPEQYVLLVGDGDAGGAAVGRPFHVLKAKLLLSQENPFYRRLLVQTFSSEHGAWSPRTEIPTPSILGGYVRWTPLLKAMVVGDVVHWLCLTDSGSYMLTFNVRSARVAVTALPASFPNDGERHRRYLLATASPGGNLVVLVADKDKISAWDWKQSSKHTKVWNLRPRVVIENETMLR